MGYQDPRQAWRDQRRAWRAQRRYYRYAYGRPGRSVVGAVIVVLVIAYVLSHAVAWLFTGAGVIVLILIGFWLLRSGILDSLFGVSQMQPPPQQQPYTPSAQTPQEQEVQQSYQPYEQGYQPPQDVYQEGGRQYQYPPQSPPQPQPGSRQYEVPQAQYPEQMPPQQQ